MCDFIKEFYSLLYKPEYLALFLSVIAICVNVYIAWKNRKYALAKEEYFKLQQVAEKIDAKLLFLENYRTKLKTFFELSYEASKNPNLIFIDANDTFDKSIFEKDGEKITALLDIYFPNIGENWNFCLDKMSELSTLIFKISKELEKKITIDWKKKAMEFNTINKDLGYRPKNIADTLKTELEKFKKKNLK